MKKIISLLIMLALICSFAACGELPNGELPNGELPNGEIPNGEISNGELPNGESPSGGNTQAKMPNLDDYPFADKDGNWHYCISLDGSLLPLANDAIILAEDNNYNEILYPVSEILDYFGVEYFWDKASGDFSTVINGIKVTRDCEDGTYMWFSNQTDGYGNSLAPRNINGVFYAPNYVFEHTIGAKLSKISKGDEQSQNTVTITTQSSYTWGKGSTSIGVMRWDGSKYVGDSGSLPSDDGGSTTTRCTNCNGSGMIRCTHCNGTGQVMTVQYVYNPATKMTEPKQVFTTCSYCSGGYKVCPVCGGTGKK